MTRFAFSWIGAFATITALLYALSPLMSDWPIWARAFVLSGLMVFSMQRVVMPLVSRLAR